MNPQGTILTKVLCIKWTTYSFSSNIFFRKAASAFIIVCAHVWVLKVPHLRKDSVQNEQLFLFKLHFYTVDSAFKKNVWAHVWILKVVYLQKDSVPSEQLIHFRAIFFGKAASAFMIVCARIWFLKVLHLRKDFVRNEQLFIFKRHILETLLVLSKMFELTYESSKYCTYERTLYKGNNLFIFKRHISQGSSWCFLTRLHSHMACPGNILVKWRCTKWTTIQFWAHPVLSRGLPLFFLFPLFLKRIVKYSLQ